MVLQHSIFQHPWPLALMLWPWLERLWCDVDCGKFISYNLSAYINSSLKKNRYSNSLLNMVVQHRIFKHPWPLCCDLDIEQILCQSSTYIKASCLKMDIVIQFPIRLCNIPFWPLTLVMWPWPWKYYLYRFSLFINANHL